MSAISSSMWIQGNHCVPLPTRPPAPRRKTGSTLRRKPPSRESTAPLRSTTTRSPMLGGAHRFLFPVARELGEKAGARRRGLGEDLVAAIAVVADRRRADQDAGLRRQAADLVDQRARADDAAVAQLLAARRRPAPVGDRLAGQVDHDADAVERRGGRRPGDHVPGEQRHARGQARGGADRVAHQRVHADARRRRARGSGACR